jgi:coenzyme PQQ precursor peptide PqqA
LSPAAAPLQTGFTTSAARLSEQDRCGQWQMLLRAFAAEETGEVSQLKPNLPALLERANMLAYYQNIRCAKKNAAGQREKHMAWTTPTLTEICIGLEINGYLPPEF